jgi:hypothetical protein
MGFLSAKIVTNRSFAFGGRANKKGGRDVTERHSGYSESNQWLRKNTLS